MTGLIVFISPPFDGAPVQLTVSTDVCIEIDEFQ